MTIKNLSILILIIFLKFDGYGQNSEKTSSNGIVKLDVFAPFMGNFYGCYQFRANKKYLSPEIGLGFMGPWMQNYTKQSNRYGVYGKAGLFLFNGTPADNPQNIWRKLYLKPELCIFKMQFDYSYPSRLYNPQIGMFEPIQKSETFNVSGTCLFLNLGKVIKYHNWVVDFSFGYGVMHKKISYDRDATNGLYLLIDKILPIQGPFPIINFDEWSDAIQGGVRIGYSIKN